MHALLGQDAQDSSYTVACAGGSAASARINSLLECAMATWTTQTMDGDGYSIDMAGRLAEFS
jgi:hypothetical protein